ncbi:unnamed protein product, partial [Ectocarpus sp. 12 AP-2014]
PPPRAPREEVRRGERYRVQGHPPVGDHQGQHGSVEARWILARHARVASPWISRH